MTMRSRTVRIALAPDIFWGFDMSSISSYGNSRVNHGQVLRAQGSNGTDGGNSEKSLSDVNDSKVDETKVKEPKAEDSKVKVTNKASGHIEKNEVTGSEQRAPVEQRLTNVEASAKASGDKVVALGKKFDSLSAHVDRKVERISNQVAKSEDRLGERLDATDETVKQNDRNSIARDKELGREIKQVNRESIARDKELSGKIDQFQQDDEVRDERLGKKIDAVRSDLTEGLRDTNAKVDALGTKHGANSKETNRRIDDLENNVNDRFDSTDKRIGDLGKRVDKRIDDVDNKLDDVSGKLGDKVDDLAEDLSTAVTGLKRAFKDVDSNKGTQLNDTVKDLKNSFNKQFYELKSQHEAETNALLEKLDEVTNQLKVLSERSAEQISVLKDQLGGLGGQLGVIIGKLDLLGGGQNLSLRSIGLFNLAANAGDGALDKLIGSIGKNSTGNQLRSVQSRLQSVSSRFGSGQPAAGLNLLA